MRISEPSVVFVFYQEEIRLGSPRRFKWQPLFMRLLFFSQNYSDMRYYFIAGEASGDLHAGNLIAELTKVRPGGCFSGVGGGRADGKRRHETDQTLPRHGFHGFHPGFDELADD